MSPYRITLLTPDGGVHEEKVMECTHDDEAIDRTGRLDHPHEIDLWQGERHVGQFPPWPPPSAWPTPHGRF